MKQIFKIYIYYFSVFLIVISNLSFSLSQYICEMSNEVKACNCVHTDDKVWDIEFNINISNEENSCCTYFVVEYSNASDYVLIERNKVNNIVIANYLPAVLNFEFDSKVNKQQTVSYQSLLSVKIPIVNSSLLI